MRNAGVILIVKGQRRYPACIRAKRRDLGGIKVVVLVAGG
jgi:hypothetical protein